MAIKISNLDTLAVISGTTIIPVVDTTGTLTSKKSTGLALKTYILGDIPTDIATLYANASSQQSLINEVDGRIIIANIGMTGYVDNKVSTANIGMRGYVDNKVSTANIGMIGYVDAVAATFSSNANVQFESLGALTVNAAIQSDLIIGINANVGVQTARINDLYTTKANLSGATFTGTINSRSVIPTSSNTFTLGNATNWFSTTFSTAVQAQYADLAENYLADNVYLPGTVLEFGGEFEVTIASDETTRLAGVVSTNPAYLMNAQLKGDNVVAIALQGRVPCKVRGVIHKGDMLVSGGNGYARPTTDPKFGTVIGKALDNYEGTDGVIEVVVGRL